MDNGRAKAAKRAAGTTRGEPKPALGRFHNTNMRKQNYLCVDATTTGCCRRNSSSVSLGTFTC